MFQQLQNTELQQTKEKKKNVFPDKIWKKI